jgi:uncharacterized OB-fold protein
VGRQRNGSHFSLRKRAGLQVRVNCPRCPRQYSPARNCCPQQTGLTSIA